jgi:hypothetical protein
MRGELGEEYSTGFSEEHINDEDEQSRYSGSRSSRSQGGGHWA